MNQKVQFELDFEAGLLDRFPTFLECLQYSAHACGKPLKTVAADLEMTGQELGRKLAGNPNDPVNFPAKRLPELIIATGDMTPIYWLIEKFCETPDAKQQRLLQEVQKALPVLMKFMEGQEE